MGGTTKFPLGGVDIAPRSPPNKEVWGCHPRLWTMPDMLPLRDRDSITVTRTSTMGHFQSNRTTAQMPRIAARWTYRQSSGIIVQHLYML